MSDLPLTDKQLSDEQYISNRVKKIISFARLISFTGSIDSKEHGRYLLQKIEKNASEIRDRIRDDNHATK